MTYDPTNALKALVRAGRQVSRPSMTSGGELQAAGKPLYETQPRPDTLCFLLLQFTTPNNSLPEDFYNIPREKGKSSAALKAHVRPDGGVFVGAFEAPDDPAGVVIVFGDPLMSENEAVKMSQQYRKQVTQEIVQRRDRQMVKLPRELRGSAVQ